MTQTITAGAGTLAYTVTGKGPALIIVHGIGGHKEDWSDVARRLGDVRTVYAVDMLGFGESSKDGERITIADQTAAIRALMDHEGIGKTDLLGNSVGGWVAATFAAETPDRTGRLILVDAAGFKAMFEGQSPVSLYPKDLGEMQALLRYVRFDPKAHEEAFAREQLAALDAAGDARAAQAVGNGMFVSDRLEDVGARITAPTLVLWGAEDKLFPPALADLVAGHIAGAAKQLIPAASHFPQLDNPDAFVDAVRSFLTL